MHIGEGCEDISKRVFTNFFNNPLQISGNYKLGKGNPN